MLLQHSHIVAIKTSGNVFSHEAVQQFNVKLKSWRDLLTEEPFTRADILTIQVRSLCAAKSVMFAPCDYLYIQDRVVANNVFTTSSDHCTATT